ncbi:MAG: B12-binding domain-containing radical SAM protein [Hungatella sp.]|nr:B12-binding domain-containing radical SAM protein [Hungatella sp.]
MKVVKTISELLWYINNFSNVYLYGAGYISNLILDEAEEQGILSKICGIYVSELENEQSIREITVRKFSEETVTTQNRIIIAVSSKFLFDIISMVSGYQVCEIVILSETFEELLLESKKRKKFQRYFDLISEKFQKSKTEYYDMVFFSPPYWDVYSPFSAVPCLTGYLRKNGFKIGQVDLGIQSVHMNMEKHWREAADFCQTRSFYEQRIKTCNRNQYSHFNEYIENLWFFHREVFPFSEVKEKYGYLNDMQKIVLDEFYSHIYEMNLSDIDFDNCENIDKVLEEYNAVDFLETLCSDYIGNILCNLPDVVGISITSTGQFLPGCLLAKIIKENCPETKIIFGGSCVDLFINSNYRNKQDINKYFDFLCMGEGETCLLQLLHYLKGDKNVELEKIPNLVFVSKEGNIKFNKQIIEDVDMLPVPDFEGLDLELYLAPRLILPYQTSRGCHYGFCAFCNHDEKYRHNYRTKKMETVVRELIYLSEKYHTDYFQFVDEAIRPDCFKKMVERMDEYPAFKKMKWFYYSRVSRLYDDKLLEKARENGCEMVMFGVETLNQRLLRFIKKGINADASRYCLKLFHECGIKTYAWLMCNLPSETLEEVQNDYNEIIKFRDKIDAICITPFMLVKNTDMSKEPEKYNIIYIDKEDPCRFLSYYNDKIIDSNAMMKFYMEQYVPLMNKWNFSKNRYTLFFDKIL